MIGQSARDGKAALDHIEARHRLLRLAQAAASRGEAGDVLHRALGRAEEIAIKRKDDVGLAEVVGHRHVHRPRLVLGPEKLRISLLHLAAQARARGRKARLGKDGHALPAAEGSGHVGEGLPEFFPALLGIILAALAGGENDLRAVRIIKIKDRSLTEVIGRAGEAGHQRITLKLRRTSVVARGHQRQCTTAARHRRRVVKRVAGNFPFHALAERHHVQFGTAAAGEADTRQRQRRAHELHEAAARNLVALKFSRALRELTLKAFLETGRVGQLFHAAPVGAATLRLRGMVKFALHR